MTLRIFTLLTAIIFCFMLFPQTTHADAFEVGCDPSELVNAINDANATPESDTLNLAPGCIYSFTEAADTVNGSTLPKITTPMVIRGNDAVIQSAPNVLSFLIGVGASLDIDHVTVERADTTVTGGTIRNEGTLTVTSSTVQNLSGACIYNYYGVLTVSDTLLTQCDMGIYSRQGSLTVLDSTIREHDIGIRVSSGDVLIDNTTISNNDGGMLLSTSQNITIQNSTIAQNTYNGGIEIATTNVLQIINSVITENTSRRVGGGISLFGSSTAHLTVIDSVITKNTASSGGGGIFLDGNAHLSVSNTIISGNSSVRDGGGITGKTGGEISITNSALNGNTGYAVAQLMNRSLTVTNSTIAGNTGGIYAGGMGSVQNSVIWGNANSQVSGNLTVSYSAIEGGYAGEGNITLSAEDTVFLDSQPASSAPTTLGNYRLHFYSPVIDKGNNAAVDGSIPVDLDYTERIKNTYVDMGAYEADLCETMTFPYTVPAGDTVRLAWAVECANRTPETVDTIELTNSVYTFTRPYIPDAEYGFVGSALPGIMSPMIINGNGATLERGSTAPHFRFAFIQFIPVGAPDMIPDDTLGTFILDGVTLRGWYHGEEGGAIMIYNNHAMTIIRNSVITNNHAKVGGAVSVYGSLPVVIINSSLEFNEAGLGGAIFIHGSNLYLVNTKVSNNARQYNWAAAISLYNDGELNLINSLVVDNWGRGVSVSNDYFGNVTAVNSTFANNQAGGIQAGVGGLLTLTNSIVADGYSGAQTSVQYSAAPNIASGEGNITLTANDTVFVNPSEGDYRLHPASPVINMGNAALLPVDEFDLDGDGDTTEPLPLDLDYTARVKHGLLDMGAYESDIDTIPPTPTPTDTPVPTDTPTLIPTDTPTPIPTDTSTLIPTETPTVTDTPTEMPVESAELLINGDFETDVNPADNQPDRWVIVNKSKDRLKCDTPSKTFAFAGQCAYLFQGMSGENAKLNQKVDLTPHTFAVGDTLTMRVQYKTNAVAPRLKVQVKVFYNNAKLPGDKFSKTINSASPVEYALFILPDYTITDANVTKIKVMFYNRATNGKIYIDDASLTLTAAQ